MKSDEMPHIIYDDLESLIKRQILNNFEKRKMLILTKNELKLHQDATACFIQGKTFPKRFTKGKNYRKGRDHFHFTRKYRGAAHSICNLRFNVLNEIPVVFHNRPTYNYNLITKELENEFKGQFECLGENTEK